MVVTGDYQEDQICQKHPDDTHLAQEAVGEVVGEYFSVEVDHQKREQSVGVDGQRETVLELS